MLPFIFLSNLYLFHSSTPPPCGGDKPVRPSVWAEDYAEDQKRVMGTDHNCCLWETVREGVGPWKGSTTETGSVGIQGAVVGGI